MRGYFSFFPMLAIVMISYLLLGIYSVHSGLSEESENAQLLLDRIYFLKADAAHSFCRAAREGPEALENWEKAIERGGSLRVEAFFGKDYAQEELFYSQSPKPPMSFDLDSLVEGEYRSADFLRSLEGREIDALLEGKILVMVDDVHKTFINSSIKPSFSASFSSENPSASSVFSLEKGDFCVFGASG